MTSQLATAILDRVQDWYFADGQRIFVLITHDITEIVDQYIKERDQEEAETIKHVTDSLNADFDTLLDKLEDGEGSLRERVRRLEAEAERLRIKVGLTDAP